MAKLVIFCAYNCQLVGLKLRMPSVLVVADRKEEPAQS
jgi:hypothetical protein